jgi:transcriptional regulator with XRE-family HTH domain
MEDDQNARLALVAALGEEVRDQRRRRRMTQRELAEAAGVHLNVIGLLERGVVGPRVGTLAQLAQALGMTGSDLLARAEARLC